MDKEQSDNVILIGTPLTAAFYRQVRDFPATALAAAAKVLAGSQRHVRMTVGFHDPAAPLIRQELTHEEPCDSFAGGPVLAARIDALLQDYGGKTLIDIPDTAAAIAALDRLSREVDDFLKDAASQEKISLVFNEAASPGLRAAEIALVPLVQTRTFLQTLLADPAKVIDDVKATLGAPDASLLNNPALRDALALPGAAGKNGTLLRVSTGPRPL